MDVIFFLFIHSFALPRLYLNVYKRLVVFFFLFCFCYVCVQLHLRVLQLLYETSAYICCQPIKNHTHIDAIDWFFFVVVQFNFDDMFCMCIGGGAIFIASYIYYRPQLFQTSLNLTHKHKKKKKTSN